MRTKHVFLPVLLLSLVLIAQPTTSYARPLATASSYGGTYTDWPTSWISISALNDPHDPSLTNERIDFVGESTNPGAYYADNSEYLFFRIRMDDGSATEFSDTIMILVDQGQNGTLDYAFMWDSQSNDQTNHGLELGIRNDEGATWADTRASDRDGNSGQKIAPPDFGLSNGDGYIRILNGQATTNFGTTTFVDFAIRWTCLSANSTLGNGQTWDIQLGSIDNANDHSYVDYDVAGGLAPTDSRTFPGTVTFPPTVVQLISLQSTNRANELPSVVLYGAIILVLISSLVLSTRDARVRRPSR